MAQPHKGDRKVVTLRLTPLFLTRLDAYAKLRGLDRNLAIVLLLEYALEDWD